MSELSPRGPHRGSFLRDIRKHTKSKREVSAEEISIFEEILKEGNSQGVFDIDDTHLYAVTSTYAIYGFGLSLVHDNVADEVMTLSRLKQTICRIVLDGIRTR